MSKPKVWFAIPSASPAKCRKTLPVWKKMGYEVAVLQNFERGDIPADIVQWYDYYPGWPGSVNILCKSIVPKDCDLIVTGGDDMLPDPNHTAQELYDQFFERFPDGFGVMQPHGDEFLAARRYCGSPFIGRAFFDSMYNGKGPMFDGYHHNYADNELYWVARGLNCLWARNDLSHFHDHFTRDGRPAPTYWASVKNNDLRDCMLYYLRVQQSFAGHEPLGRKVPFDTTMDRSEMLVLADQRLLQMAVENPCTVAIGKGLAQAQLDGCRRVAIYGFGLHTRAAAAAIMEPCIPIDCIIEDNPAHHGRTPWQLPVVSMNQALQRPIDAIILSGKAVEDKLWDNTSAFRARGGRVYRLYSNTRAETPAHQPA